LSAEKTPTLWGTLPAFEALITKLRQHQRSQTTHIASFEIVEYGIEKLEEYEQETTTVPAYTLSLCK
jgi:hypothetical protein